MNKNFIFGIARLIFFVFLQRVSLIRPAPIELPQVRNEARVDGCSGAI